MLAERMPNMIPSAERESKINFLDKELWVLYRFEQEALKHLPEISREDIANHQERYGVLLGDHAMINGKMRVVIKAVVQMEGNDHRYFKEGIEEVQVSLANVKNLVKSLQENDSECRTLKLVGDFHTHPIMPHEFQNGLKPWEPSPVDIQQIALEYANEVLSEGEPFIFGVAGPNENGETHYEFYKMNRSDEGTYSYEKINADSF